MTPEQARTQLQALLSDGRSIFYVEHKARKIGRVNQVPLTFYIADNNSIRRVNDLITATLKDTDAPCITDKGLPDNIRVTTEMGATNEFIRYLARVLCASFHQFQPL